MMTTVFSKAAKINDLLRDTCKVVYLTVWQFSIKIKFWYIKL